MLGWNRESRREAHREVLTQNIKSWVNGKTLTGLFKSYRVAFLPENVHNQSIHMSFTFPSFADVLNNCSDDSRKGRWSIWITTGWYCSTGVTTRQYWMRAEMSYAAEVMTKYQNLLRYLRRMPKQLLASAAPSWKQENKQLLGWHNERWKEGKKSS